MTHTIAAEIVANVGALLVSVGDRVGPADPVVLLESMKMEIPVLAEVNGVVRELSVAVGDVVREGDVLAVVDEE